MKGLREATRGMRLVDTNAVVAQGKRAYHLGIEHRDNPKKSDLERQCWSNGWVAARDRWMTLLKRNEGCLGMRPSLASPSFS